MVGFFKIESPKNFWTHDFICLRSKTFSFKCGNYTEKKLKSNSKSQPKRVHFEESYSGVFGVNYQKDCDNLIIKSVNHDTYFQKIREVALDIII